MTITELISLLDEVGDDAEIQLATQASYPLRYDLRGVYVEPDNGDGEPADELVVWLVEGQQDRNNPYDVPEYAFAAARTALLSDDPPRGRLGRLVGASSYAGRCSSLSAWPARIPRMADAGWKAQSGVAAQPKAITAE